MCDCDHDSVLSKVINLVDPLPEDERDRLIAALATFYGWDAEDNDER